MQVPGYDVFEQLVCLGPYAVHRGRRMSDRLPVLIEAADRVAPSRADSEALARQFELTRDGSIAGVTRALEFVRTTETACLVLEDRGLVPLATRFESGRLDLQLFFSISTRLSAILDVLHRRSLSHGFVNPASVLIDPDGRDVQLLNVGFAPGVTADLLGRFGSRIAAYISPEQTGRINRTVDYRTDFYSLGVTLYEALTGAPPFTSDDALELIHAHIAKTAPVPASPEQVARIVLKLLAKAAEDRYQSAVALRQDLERCEREWTATQTISSFELARHDVSDRFVISQKLYGRDRELADLLKAFDETCEGRTALALVSGYSGIGKTSIIHALYKPIVRQRGYFIAGKFDQVVRNIPYGAFTQALRNLIWQLLTESEDRLAEWRTRLADALGANGGVLAEVIPEIELILGKQAPPPPVDPAEARNRFGYVFQRFVSTLAQREHPLVVFLDDLQWVDTATLDLLHALLTGPDIHYLLLLGAYRDNEVDAGHPLTWAVNRLQTAGASVSHLSLGPLDRNDLSAFLCDTLHREPKDVDPLAGLIQKKTDGNPFFVIQFLKTLENEGHFTFDRAHAGWSFGMDAIAAAGMTDNVIDLMTRKIQRLSAGAQKALTLAACIGNQFDWETYLTVSGQARDEASGGLLEALDAGLIQEGDDPTRRSDSRARTGAVYSFLHDRVQQAAYGLIPDTQKKRAHLEVGRLLVADLDTEGADDRLFGILNHLNIGSDLITSGAERLALARLNLAAGRKAKTSAAYRAALGYLEKGATLLDEAHWGSEYDLMFALHREAAECQILAGAFAEAEASLDRVLRRAATPLDRAHVHSLRITLYENQSRWIDAVSAGREALRLFGISFPERSEDKQAALDREVEAVQQQLGGRTIASLIDLPEMTDPDMRMVMRTLTVLWAPAYISGDEVLARLISATIVRLSLTYGNTADSAYGYVTHAITIGPIRNNYRSAYDWGELALSVNRRFDDLKLRAKVYQQFQAHVNLWCRPLDTCIPLAREAWRSGLDAGDFAYAGYGAASEAWAAWLVARSLDQFVCDYTPTLAFLAKTKMGDFETAHRIILNWALALQARTSGNLSLSGGGFDEDRFIERYESAAPFFLTFLYTARLHLAVLHEQFAEGVAAAHRARQAAVTGTIWPVLIDFWGGLAAAGVYESGTPDERRMIWQQLLAADRSLAALAESCPENFSVFSLLISGELQRLASRPDEAAALYQRAIGYSRQTGNVQLEGLAHELCARLWHTRGDDVRARGFASDAYRCYAAWGATAKLTQLQDRYGPLGASTRAAIAADPRSTASVTERPPSVDMSTVLKVAHAIAVELEVEGLLRTLMKLALENAGAQRGVFLQERDRTLVAEAQAVADGESVSLGPPTKLDAMTDVAITVVRYVHRTGQNVVIGNAATDEQFATDPYIARSGVRSILCVPVGHQGRLGGILYLENNLTTDAFTPDRIEMMRVLAAQTAISLENARLYEDMRSEVHRRTAAEGALRDALSEVEALKNRLEAENVYLQEEIRIQHNFNEIVGNSPVLLDALRKVERVAPTDTTVLIIGETGSGKELFARAIHSRSRRSNRPLVKVNCGAIPPGLVESELFGHVKGAFTGAIDKRVGRFELANGGTIFLDEIGELPREAQVKLLRVLQEQEFEPVGSSRTIRVSVRVITATNRNLDEAVRDGRFRADLLYRLNVFPIEVPALRDRTCDIPLLVGFFASGLARKLGKPIHGFSARSMERMTQYSWPGNVRELQNIVERAAILAHGPILGLESTILGGDVVTTEAPGEVPGRPDSDRPESLDEIQRIHIIHVLKTTGGVVEGAHGAATILGLHPNTLRSRMKKLGITTSSRLPA